MNTTLPLAVLLSFTAPHLSAQDTDAAKQDPKPAAKQEVGTRYVIHTTSAITTERKMTRDGEEADFGRGGDVEPTPTKTVMTIEFEEGLNPEGKATWRHYSKAEASIERAGRDGEPRTMAITSALAGKKVFMTAAEDGAMTAHENDADGAALDERLVLGVPMRTDLSGLAPAADVAVGDEAELDAKFAGVLRSLVHPIRAGNAGAEQPGQGRRGRGADGAGGAGGADQPRGRRGRGAGEGEGGGEEGQPRGRRGRGAGGAEGGDADTPQGRGGRQGRGQFGRRAATANDIALSTIASKAVEWTGTWKIESIEEQDAGKIATISVKATGKGKGDAAALGMNAGGFGGRMRGGRRGGGNAGGADSAGPESEARASIALSGTYVVNLANGNVHRLDLEGVLDASVDMSMTMRESEIEIHTETTGPFTIKVERADG